MASKRKLRFWGVGIGLGILAISLTFVRPYWLLAIVARQSPDVTFFIETDLPIIALTIDDAPDPDTTPSILDVLSQHDAKATFFLIGEQVKAREVLVERIVAEGHELGNHTMRDEPSYQLSPPGLESSMAATHRILSAFDDIYWFRPGSGWYSKTILMKAHQYEYRVALGSIFPFDTHIHSVDFATQYILGNARPGAIVVLHDGGERGVRTANTLQRVLPALSERGYKITSLSVAIAGSRESQARSLH